MELINTSIQGRKQDVETIRLMEETVVQEREKNIVSTQEN